MSLQDFISLKNNNSQQDGHFGWRGNPIEVYETTPSKSMESKETQTERKMSCFRQFLRCVVADLGKYCLHMRIPTLCSTYLFTREIY